MNETRFPSRLSALAAAALLAVCGNASAAWGLTSDSNFYTIDTGAGLVFKVRRTDNGSSTQSAGDIASMVYNGVQYQDQSRGSQITSGFDYLYNGVSAVTVNAAMVGTNAIKVTVQAGNLTHYYMARQGINNIYMGTYFTSEPDIHNLVRYIVRVPIGALPNGPAASDLRNTTNAIEASDVFVQADGQTRSKHYSNMRLRDWSYFGATGNGVGMWFVRDNNEGGSGGPFYRALLNQATAQNQELTYIVNYGEAQTEPFRTHVLNAYTLVFNNGSAPATPDTSWFGTMGLLGYVAPAGRGGVAGVGIAGRDTSKTYTVGFANATAQYWGTANASTGSYQVTGMRPGTYTQTIYKNELAVHTSSVTVSAGQTVARNTITIGADPSASAALWRIGDWDGSPRELLNGDKVTTMHPSDVRMAGWSVPIYVVGASSAAAGFPAYLWKNVNSPVTVRFNLGSGELLNRRVRVGITTAFSNARPVITVNNWTSAVPAISTQPSTRTLTVGTYRGNNTMYSFDVPASAFVAGANTLTVGVASGSTGSGYLNPGMSIDAVDMVTP